MANYTMNDNSREVLAAEKLAIEKALNQIGSAAKKNIQGVILEKDIYDTGDLYRTIDYNVKSSDKSVDVGSPQNYAEYQELGTSRQAARPFIKPGVNEHMSQYKDILLKALKG